MAFDTKTEARRWFRAIWPGLAPDENIISLLAQALDGAYDQGARDSQAAMVRPPSLKKGFCGDYNGDLCDSCGDRRTWDGCGAPL